MEIYRFSILDLLPYFILLLSLFFLVNNKVKGMDSSTGVCWILIFFSSIRVGTGYDYYAYKRLIQGEVMDFTLDRIEPLAKLVMDFSGFIHYQLFYVITSFLIIFPLYKVVQKYSKDPALSLAIYILFPVFFIESMSIIRNAVAFTLVFAAFISFIDKKYLYALVLFITAIGFHISALVAILLLPIYYLKRDNIFNWILYIISLGLSSVVMTILVALTPSLPLLEVVTSYVLKGDLGAGDTMMILLNFIGLINLIFWNKLKAVDNRNILWLNIVNWGIVLWNVFGFEGTLRLRLSLFFLIFMIILLPSYIYIVGSRYQKLVKEVICLFFLLIFSSSFYINIESHLRTGDKISFLPYQSVFYNVRYSLYENQ